MKKKYLKISCGIVAISSAQASYFKGLEYEANQLCEKIWRGLPVTQETLTDSLSFISKKDLTVDYPIYSQAQSFSALIEKTKNHRGMESFCTLCQILYEQTADRDKRSTLHMLMERVEDLYEKNVKLSEKIKKTATCNGQIEVNFETDLNSFFNADRKFIAH